MKIENMSVDDVLFYWYNTGAFGYEVCYARIIKVGKKKIKVRFERGEERWKYINYFSGKISKKSATQLQHEGVNI